MSSVYCIAGEASGDFLGAKLLKALKEKEPNLHFAGVGGLLMRAEGLTSLFPMEEISLMGIAEIIPHIPNVMKRINQTVQHILTVQPKVLVTIDSTGFCFRVVKKLQRLGIFIPVVHYVAPSVWAWRPKRAKRLVGLVDHLLTLFPFEPPYFTKYGLQTTFVGHPLVEDQFDKKIKKDPNAILLLPGSRLGEVERHWPIFLKTAQILKNENPSLSFYTPTFPHLLPLLKEQVPENFPVHFSLDSSEKWTLFQKASVALAASGTVSLELAKASTPMVVAYRVNQFTYQLLKRIIYTPYVSLVNILLNKPVVPELLQEHCTAGELAHHMGQIIKNPSDQKKDLEKAVQLLKSGEDIPSHVAANVVLSYVKNSEKTN